MTPDAKAQACVDAFKPLAAAVTRIDFNETVRFDLFGELEKLVGPACSCEVTHEVSSLQIKILGSPNLRITLSMRQDGSLWIAAGAESETGSIANVWPTKQIYPSTEVASALEELKKLDEDGA